MFANGLGEVSHNVNVYDLSYASDWWFVKRFNSPPVAWLRHSRNGITHTRFSYGVIQKRPDRSTK